MKKQDIIDRTIKMIQREAYTALICDEIQGLGFDTTMMKFHRDMAIGKACGGLEILALITGNSNDDIYYKAVEEATQDIRKTDYDIVAPLNLAGFDGRAYKAANK